MKPLRLQLRQGGDAARAYSRSVAAGSTRGLRSFQRATIGAKEAPDASEQATEARTPEDAGTSTDEPAEPRRDPTGARSGGGEGRQGADAEGQPGQAQLLTAEAE